MSDNIDIELTVELVASSLEQAHDKLKEKLSNTLPKGTQYEIVSVDIETSTYSVINATFTLTVWYGPLTNEVHTIV